MEMRLGAWRLKMVDDKVKHAESIPRNRAMQLAHFADRARRNGSLASIAEILVTTLMAILIFRVVVTSASLTMLGIWSLTQSLTAIVRMADTGVTGALSRYVGAINPRERALKTWEFVDSALIMNLVFYVILTICAYWPLTFALSKNLPADQAVQADAILPIILINMILSALQGVPASALIGLRQGALKSFSAIVSAFIWLIATLVLFPKEGIEGLALAQTCQIAFNLVACWLFLSHTLGTFHYVPRLNVKLLKSTLGFSLTLQFNTIISQLYEVVLRLALSRFGGASSVGLYELTDRFIKVARQIILLPSLLIVPIISQAFTRGRLRAARVINERQMRLNIAAATVVFGCLVLIAPVASLFVLRRLDPHYLLFLAIVWVASFINVLGIPAYTLGLGSGKLRYNLIGNLWTLIGTLILANVGGYFFGAVGALVGGTSMLATGAILITLLNSRYFGWRAFPTFKSLQAIIRPSEWQRIISPILK